MSGVVQSVEALFDQYRRIRAAIAQEFARKIRADPSASKRHSEYLASGRLAHAEEFSKSGRLIRKSFSIIRELERRTGLTVTTNGEELSLSGHIGDKPVTFHSGNIAELPRDVDKWSAFVGSPKSVAGAVRNETPFQPAVSHQQPAVSASAESGLRHGTEGGTRAESFAGRTEMMEKWVADHNILGGVAGVAAVGGGVFMTIDGFRRVRRGLGYDSKQDKAGLNGKSGSVIQTVAGGTEMLAGATIATVGGWTGILALMAGKGRSPTV
jgi:hypothetical protein